MTVEELGAYGIDRMDDEGIERFLGMQSQGVLGLPTDAEPYLLPMSYGYDSGDRLYFYFLVGSESRKRELADVADAATFLVYNAEMFHWRSVLLTGRVRERETGDEDGSATLSESRTPAWRPELLETASETEETRPYEFLIEDWTGLRHDIQPPAMDQRSSRDGRE